MSGPSQRGVWGKALGVSGALALLSSAASDFFKPLFNSTLYLALFFLGLTLLAGAIQLFAGERRRAEIRRIEFLDIGKYWFGCLFTALVLFTGFLLVTYTLNSDDPDGYLAENVPFIASLQKKWHVVEKHLADISENTRKTAEHAEAIEEHAKATEEHAGKSAELLEKMVNPLDARKQLAQLGLKYDIETYSQAVLTGDQEIIKLFFDAGMKPLSQTPDGSCAFFNAILTGAPNWPETLNLVLSTFHIKPNDLVGIYELVRQNKRHFELINNWFLGDLFLPKEVYQNIIQDQLGNRVFGTSLSDVIALSAIDAFNAVRLKVIKDLSLNMEEGIAVRDGIARLYEEYFSLITEAKGVPEGPEFDPMRNSILTARKLWYTPEKERLFRSKIAQYRQATETLKAFSAQIPPAVPQTLPSGNTAAETSQPSWKTQKSNPHIWRNK